MISLYTGTPGSYKSYDAVRECLSWLRKGKNVIANFPVNYKKRYKRIKGNFLYVPTADITVDYLLQFAKTHHNRKSYKAQTLVIIDEASIKFNSRDFKAYDRMNWIQFLANHRHFNFDFILVAQSDKMIDKQIRALVESELKHRSLKNYKLLGKVLDFIFRGLYMVIDYWYAGQLRNSSRFCLFDKSIANCYDTMALFIDGYGEDSAFQSVTLPDGSKCVAPFKYDEVKNEITQFKFKNMVFKGKKMADKMAEIIKVAYPGVEFDAITFVPVSEQTRKTRGYDQSEILSKRLSDALDIPCVHLLSKYKQNKTQHDLPRSERADNINDCYNCSSHQFKNILLIDDICTTGFTLSKCSELLRLDHDCNVYCAVYALTINF